MTTPNPTPTTRERAEQNAIQLVANLNINQALSNNHESTFEIIAQAFAAALARERREVLTEAIQVVRSVVFKDELYRTQGMENALAATREFIAAAIRAEMEKL